MRPATERPWSRRRSRCCGALETDEPNRRSQLRGDTFPSASTFTAVLAYEGDDGVVHDRVFVAFLANTARITGVTLLQMPLG